MKLLRGRWQLSGNNLSLKDLANSRWIWYKSVLQLVAVLWQSRHHRSTFFPLHLGGLGIFSLTKQYKDQDAQVHTVHVTLNTIHHLCIKRSCY